MSSRSGQLGQLKLRDAVLASLFLCQTHRQGEPRLDADVALRGIACDLAVDLAHERRGRGGVRSRKRRVDERLQAR